MAFIDTTYQLDKPMPAFLFLMRHLGVRQNEAQKIVATGRLRVNGEVMTESGKTIQGEITVKTFIPQPRGTKPVFTTPDFGLFDKPSGTLVHPTTHRTPYSMLDDIRHIYGLQANAVHRIDMETSGLLLASRNKEAERTIKIMFEEKKVQKIYLAWVRGRIDKPFRVEAPLRQNTDFSTVKLKMLVDPTGKPSVTEFEPLEYDPVHDTTLVKAVPLTGRQHQIRVHLFHVKHPILGDPIYGVPTEIAIRYLDKILHPKERLKYMGARRLMLHAQELDFVYEGVRYRFVSRIDFRKAKREIVLPSERMGPVYC